MLYFAMNTNVHRQFFTILELLAACSTLKRLTLFLLVAKFVLNETSSTREHATANGTGEHFFLRILVFFHMRHEAIASGEQFFTYRALERTRQVRCIHMYIIARPVAIFFATYRTDDAFYAMRQLVSPKVAETLKTATADTTLERMGDAGLAAESVLL